MSGLSKRQIEAMKNNSATPTDILENGDYVKELNEEIAGTYDQRVAAKRAAKDTTLEGASAFDFDRDFDAVEAPADDGIIPFEEDMDMTDEIGLDIPAEDTLEKELEAVKAKLAQEQAARAQEQEAAAPAEPELSPEEQMKDQVLQMLAEHKKGPSKRQIAALKARYGENGVHAVAFGKDDIYIFTHLRRSQWKKIQEVVATMAQSQSMSGDADAALKEKVVQNCVLWPTEVRNLEATFLHNSRAGLIDTMFELIMLHSYFLTPGQAMNLTVSL